jgi:hypothetical protein
MEGGKLKFLKLKTEIGGTTKVVTPTSTATSDAWDRISDLKFEPLFCSARLFG